MNYSAVYALLAVCLAGAAACAPATAPPIALTDAKDEAVQVPAVAAPAQASFIVSFRPSHALGRAQLLQSGGRSDEAERLVGVALRDDEALRGLCFERFTLGGAEIVLNACAPSPWEEPLVTQRRWLEQLGATPGVAYVDPNLVAHREDAIEAPPS